MKKYRRYSKARLGPTTQKLLLLLMGGLAIGLSGSPVAYFSIITAIGKEWSNINRRALHYAIKKLYKSKLIDAKDNPDSTTTLTLTNKGKALALTYQIDDIKVPHMKRWDGKWRIVLFDIPEKHKKARDALSRTLKNAGFLKFQKSVFIHPFECRNETDFIIEFFDLRQHVRIVTAIETDNELHLKKHFDLI